ncbi:MAG: STAS domain-containing protein [Sedimentisphaerales bacterium]|nr:STAS domain-containing protein [Sedimentisphaerales bacterium]
MELLTQQRGAVMIVRPMGPLTGAEAEPFRTRVRELIRENLGRVVIDASAVPYVDSGGLESLADVAAELAQGGKGLKVYAANQTVRQVIELTGLAPQFEHFDDANSAVRSFL